MIKEHVGENSLGHPGGSGGHNYIAVDVVLLSLNGHGVGQSDEGQLSGGIIGLTKVTIDSRVTGCHDDTTVVLFSHDRPGSLGCLEGSFDVDILDQVPIL